MTNSKDSFVAPRHVLGLDSLRFWAAMWVLMGHGAIPPLTQGHDDSRITWAINGFYSGSISGPAAVILFFLISGFCIHYPFSDKGAKLEIKSFFARRYVRIAAPMVAALVVARLSGTARGYDDLLAGIPAWSLIAEIIYYTLYPILRRVASRFGWMKIFAGSFIIALIGATSAPIDSVNYTMIGGIYWGSWILGLPCWILGVMIAERLRAGKLQKLVSTKIIWMWRGMGIILGAVTHTLALQQIIGQHWTLNLFAIYAFYWLIAEINYYRDHPPVIFFERLGTQSYSIYLIHIPAAHLYDKMHLPYAGHVMDWAIKVLFSLLLSMIFYQLVEKPSHLLARRLGRIKTIKTAGLSADSVTPTRSSG